jgi:hypothetical protein
MLVAAAVVVAVVLLIIFLSLSLLLLMFRCCACYVVFVVFAVVVLLLLLLLPKIPWKPTDLWFRGPKGILYPINLLYIQNFLFNIMIYIDKCTLCTLSTCEGSIVT